MGYAPGINRRNFFYSLAISYFNQKNLANVPHPVLYPHHTFSDHVVALVLFSSLVSLSPVAAVQTDHKREGAGDLDLKCEPGYYPEFETSSFQYNLPVERFIDATDSFQRMEWYVSMTTFYSQIR